MGNWSMGIKFWIKYLLTLPFMLLLYLPYWIIKPFSKETASKYGLYMSMKTSFIDVWLVK